MTFAKTTAAVFAVLAIAGCAQQEEEEVMMIEEEPIFAKDGTIIGMRPMVSGGSSMGGPDTRVSNPDTPQLENRAVGATGEEDGSDDDG